FCPFSCLDDLLLFYFYFSNPYLDCWFHHQDIHFHSHSHDNIDCFHLVVALSLPFLYPLFLRSFAFFFVLPYLSHLHDVVSLLFFVLAFYSTKLALLLVLLVLLQNLNAPSQMERSCS